ncbi:polysaccharide export protein EpsE [Methylobacillus sp.]|uniref:polysaccharide export protein EpsE n=1 Tax=Methylobacillus sp. TaxID=56818 RepID=UPI002FDF28F0
MMNKMIRWLFTALLVMVMAGVHAAESDTVLGPGDVLKISVFEQPDLSLEVRVSESGTITYPLIGEVQIGGESTAAAERKIASMLERGGYLKNPHVNIIVAQLQSQQVSVLGQVNRPGRYPLDSARTLADVLALAGGVALDGGDFITVLRNKDDTVVREEVDLTQIMHKGILERNIKINGGDIVYVERSPRFYIYGEVQRPSQYKLERNMTVLQALSTGGGLSLRGTERGIKIKRQDDNGVIQIIDARPDDLLKPNDVVYVKESLF